jgi:Protein of unknown function (DUF3043)
MSETTDGSNAGKKGKATPKRRDAQARTKVNSLAPATSKEAKAHQRELEKARRVESRAAFMRGDESALPARDRGPAKRWVRNYIDSRRTIGEYFLPTIMLVLVLTVIPVKAIQLLAILFMYAAMLYSLLSAVFMGRKIKKLVAEKFPNEPLKGIGIYGWLRSTQMRRMRAPAPQVKRGDSF